MERIAAHHNIRKKRRRKERDRFFTGGIKILVCCLLLNCGLFWQMVQAQTQSPKLHARSALLMDASNGRVLFEENGYEVMPNASTTKIMTCILALEYRKENPSTCLEVPVTVSKKASQMPKVHLGMREGEHYMLDDLLYSLMLESHNDTAVAVAEYVAGSVEDFADRMNEKAKELGCENTHFVTPNGLDGKRDGLAHVTTAYDLGLITAYALKNEAFREIITTRNKSITNCEKNRQFSLYNRDAFLDLMDGACGVKTGFTSKAGYCFVGALERDGKQFISVLLACGWPPNKTWKWLDTKELMNYGLREYEKVCISRDYPYEKKRIPVEGGVTDTVGVYLDCNMEEKKEQLTLLLSKEDRIEVKRSVKNRMEAPVEKGTVVGYELYEVNGKPYKTYPVKCAESVILRTYFYCVREIFMLYFIRM